MPLNFPDSPTLNEIYTSGSNSWQWDGTARVVVSGYPDRDIRLAGYLPLKTLQYSVSAQDVQTYFPSSLDIAQVYGYLKTLGDFIFAEDA